MGSGLFEPTGGVLLALAVGILALALLAVTFGGFTLVARFRHLRRDALREALKERWTPVLGQYLTGDASRESVLEEVEAGRELVFVSFLLEYVRRLRGEEEGRIRELAGPFLPRVAAQVAADRAELRARAVQTLGDLGLPGYAPVLLDALDDPSALVSMVAARGLCQGGRVDHLLPVLDRIQRFQRWSRRMVASMLAGFGPESAPILRRVLVEESRPKPVRAVAAWALADLNDAEAADLAADLLAREEDQDLKVSCLRVLETVGRPEHAPAVAGRLSDPSQAVRAAAARALGALGSVEDCAVLLELVAGDPSPWVAIGAGRSIRSLGGQETLRKLIAENEPRSELALELLEGE